MLVVTSYGASDGMFMLFQQNTTELSDLRSPFNPSKMDFFTNTAYAVSGLIMKIIKDLIIHKKKRRLRL